MAKKTKKSVSKKPKKVTSSKQSSSALWVALAVIVLVAVGVGIVIMHPWPKVIATIDSHTISDKDLDMRYKLAVPLDQRESLSSLDYLESYYIPQVLLLDKAESYLETITEDEIDESIIEVATSQQLTVDEFAEYVQNQGLDVATVRNIIRENLAISAYLDDTILNTIEVDPQSVEEIYASASFQAAYNLSREEALEFITNQLQTQQAAGQYVEYMQSLVRNATIVIYPYEKDITKRFTKTGEPVCSDSNGMLPLVMFTSSTCESCATVAYELSTLLGVSSKVNLAIWEVDTGDNLMTSQKESGVPSQELAYYRTHNPQSTVPFFVLGCAYAHHGLLEQNDRVFYYLLAQLENDHRE